VAGRIGGRNTGIDLLRGLLVLAVILGHFSELTQRTSFLTWVGAGVRMPLFIGLAGYLFNLQRARSTPLPHLLFKYYDRLILPWLVATTVYLAITDDIAIMTPLSILLWPPFHLWFVPVMMAFILIATLTRRPPLTMLATAIPVSITAMYLFGAGHSAEQLGWMPDRRFFIYSIYFFYGLRVAERGPDKGKYVAALILAPIGFLWWCGLYGARNPAAEVAAELTSCLPLICLLPLVWKFSAFVPVLVPIGRDSLFFYLWHPMAFALWAACGIGQQPMLIASILTLIAARSVLRRHPSTAHIFGLAAHAPAIQPLPLVEQAVSPREIVL
jgi:acyltransferase